MSLGYLTRKLIIQPYCAQIILLRLLVVRSPDIEADFVKIFFNETTQTFQTQDAFMAKKAVGRRYCNLQVKISLYYYRYCASFDSLII